MENVDALVSKKYIDSFNNWLERLENLGYHYYYQVINAKNAGVPQNRKRIFVFSILKQIDTGKFTFPVPFDNGIRLKDVLENTVEERYYLSDEKVASFLGNLIKTEDEDTVSIIYRAWLIYLTQNPLPEEAEYRKMGQYLRH